MRTIRARIAIWAFGVLLLLVGLQSALVLGGLDRALQQVADRELRGELDALAREAADVRLVELGRMAGDPDTRLGDLIFEIRDVLERGVGGHDGTSLYVLLRGDDIVDASPALRDRGFDATSTAIVRSGIAYREAPDPRSPDAAPLRIASLPLGPYRLEIARSLGPFASLYRSTRTQLLVILGLVSALGAVGSYAIARRALLPVRRLVDEARRLRTLSEGSLPRSGRADEIDDLAAVLNELLARVRADLLRIQRFTADAAHEIRTPLAAIRGHLELLLEKVDADAQGTLASVLEEVERLSRLVNQLLLLEELQQTPDPDAHRHVDLGEIAAELVEHLRVLAQEQEIVLEGAFQESPVQGDPEKLRQVLLNLIDNALKFTPPGGRVRVTVRSTETSVCAEVSDSGQGVNAEQADQIFERFASDRSLSRAGTGLGLPIARAIARAQGGDLTVTPGVGATFVCTLPLARRRIAPSSPPDSERPRTPAT